MGDSVENTLSLGKRLRLITNQARAQMEANKFVEVLTAAAEKGQESISFPDLRDYLNNMIMDNTVWEWFRINELNASGSIDQTTGAYVYTISW